MAVSKGHALSNQYGSIAKSKSSRDPEVPELLSSLVLHTVVQLLLKTSLSRPFSLKSQKA